MFDLLSLIEKQAPIMFRDFYSYIYDTNIVTVSNTNKVSSYVIFIIMESFMDGKIYF